MGEWRLDEDVFDDGEIDLSTDQSFVLFLFH